MNGEHSQTAGNNPAHNNANIAIHSQTKTT